MYKRQVLSPSRCDGLGSLYPGVQFAACSLKKNIHHFVYVGRVWASYEDIKMKIETRIIIVLIKVPRHKNSAARSLYASPDTDVSHDVSYEYVVCFC